MLTSHTWLGKCPEKDEKLVYYDSKFVRMDSKFVMIWFSYVTDINDSLPPIFQRENSFKFTTDFTHKQSPTTDVAVGVTYENQI